MRPIPFVMGSRYLFDRLRWGGPHDTGAGHRPGAKQTNLIRASVTTGLSDHVNFPDIFTWETPDISTSR